MASRIAGVGRVTVSLRKSLKEGVFMRRILGSGRARRVAVSAIIVAYNATMALHVHP
jgi:hypothetical protein